MRALVAELGKRTSVCWLRHEGEEHAAWHVWHDDALLLVSGGTEQSLPDIEDGERVEVIMRSKENGGRLVTWVGRPMRVLPGSGSWDSSVAALASARLSIPSLSETPRSWAVTSVVTRVEPTGEFVEAPGSLSPSSHSAPPRATSAITRGALPRVLHRRKTRRPKLS